MPQLKMLPAEELERFARNGAKLEIERQLQRHQAMDKRFPGILREALHAVRANGRHVKAAAPAEAEPEPKRRTMSAAARRRISIAQKARWRKQRKEAKSA